ncbi:MAG: integrin alpha [Chloroflexota bacterium]|nr:integrin alpha [Chloroflexota bacterium]
MKKAILLVIAMLLTPVLLFRIAIPACAFSADTSLSATYASFVGEDEGDHSGCSVASAGDVNGDGYDDILIGACWDEEGGEKAGQTYLILGKTGGWSMGVDLSMADASFVGEHAGGRSGFSVASAGDVNGDGYADILIGAFGDSEGGSNAGQTYLILGKASGWTLDTPLSWADASFVGEDENDCSGVSVASAGDVNGDGYDDILIGAACDEDGGDDAGQTYLILGKASGWAMDTSLSSVDASFIGEYARDRSGWSVATAGDMNGDGYDDILIGAHQAEENIGIDPKDNGKTYLILGKGEGWAMDVPLSMADASFIGESAGDHSGWVVATAGNVNGDNYDDILIGAYQAEDDKEGAGKVYLVLGKAEGWTTDIPLSMVDASFIGEQAEDGAGYSVSSAGDVNADGYDDILIGARWAEDSELGAGKTYLILGKEREWTTGTSLSSADISFNGEDAGDNFGSSVASAGSVNGDEYDDILIAARWDEVGGAYAGQTYLVLSNYPVLISCNSNGDRVDQFFPGENVYVKGVNLEPNTEYRIWIQDDPITAEDSTLHSNEDPSSSLEEITTDDLGNFGPALIWSIPSDIPNTFRNYDIVANKGVALLGQSYSFDDDHIDSLGVVGFVAPVPELPTVTLLSMGLAGLVGWFGLRRWGVRGNR